MLYLNLGWLLKYWIMSERPAIPAEIVRQILIESGHRCAVCGTNCPLERAHIVPWHKSKEHKTENLICLCASCHERADLENWGAKTLREYKQKPWILRQYNEAAVPTQVAKFQLIADLEFKDFDEPQRRLLQFAIAAFLDISPDCIKVVSVEETNSVKIALEIPVECVDTLLIAYRTGDLELSELLAPYKPKELIPVSTPEMNNEVVIIRLSGKMTMGEKIGDLNRQVRSLLNAGRKRILIDLGQLSYIDSAGVGTLVSTYALVKREGGELKLLNITKKLSDLLVITKLIAPIDVYDDEQTAISAFD